MKEIANSGLKARLDDGDSPFLLDVREADELANGTLPGVVHIPMGEVPSRVAEIPSDQDVVVTCRSGGRSGKTVEFLMSQGYTRVFNLVGGMNAWARDIDPGCKVY